MIFRILFLAIGVAAILYLFKNLFWTSDFGKCGKCSGKGFWIATRGEKATCDVCSGSGKVRKRM